MSKTNEKIRVGIIGMAPGRSWAAVAIAPALQALEDFELVAVSTRRMESAKASAKEFGIPLAFDNHKALATHPNVDLVVVAVRVPAHFELVTAALESGKHVYCEWPLANGLDEGEKFVTLAKKRGVRGFVGLQLRSAPFLQYIRDLLGEGYVGKVMSTSIVTPGLLCGPDVEAQNDYTVDIRNGANMLTVTFGHAIDAALYAVQQKMRTLNATTATLRTTVRVIETGTMIPMTAEDQVAVTGTLSGDAVFCAHFWGGPASDGDTGFQWRIQGTEGELKMTAAGVHIQVVDVTIEGARGDARMQVLPLPSRYKSIPNAKGPAQYVAQGLARMAADLRNGTTTCPTFEDAMEQLRIIDAIRQAAKTGQRQVLAN
jgi:predicted dehydrogenase